MVLIAWSIVTGVAESKLKSFNKETLSSMNGLKLFNALDCIEFNRTNNRQMVSNSVQSKGFDMKALEFDNKISKVD